MTVFNNLAEMIRLNKLLNLLSLRDQQPWKRRNKNRTSMSAAPGKIRAHKRARWEMAKLSRRANRK